MEILIGILLRLLLGALAIVAIFTVDVVFRMGQRFTDWLFK